MTTRENIQLLLKHAPCRKPNQINFLLRNSLLSQQQVFPKPLNSLTYFRIAILFNWNMKSKSEMIATSLGKVIFVVMAFFVVVELSQTRNVAKYILKARLS